MTPFTPRSAMTRFGIFARNIAQLLDFVVGRTGGEYGAGMVTKLILLRRIRRNSRHRGSASSFMEQVQLVEAILNLPRSTSGVVAEFGAFKGMSSATLSLACAITKRRLIVFDSFEGLPTPEEVRDIVDGHPLPYEKGGYCGTLDEVKANIRAFGRIEVCEFVKGFYSDTLASRNSEERYAFVFEDADLPSSVRDVVRYVWTRLQPGCPFFCHEARDFDVVAIFFDSAWWENHVGCRAPGLVASGMGVELSASGSSLCYAVKQ
jgi:hypothetical protein